MVGGLLYDAGLLVAGRHPHGRARLRTPGRGHGRAGGTRPLHRRHDQRGRLVGALRDRPGVPVPPPCPSTSTSSPRSERLRPSCCRALPSGRSPDDARRPSPPSRRRPRAWRGRLTRRPQLEAGARLLHLHRGAAARRSAPPRLPGRRWRRGRSSTSATSCMTATATAPRRSRPSLRTRLGRTTCMACVEAPADRAADDRRHAPPPCPRGRARSAPPADARELRQAGHPRQVGPDAGSLEQEVGLQDPDARKEPVEYVWFVGDFASFDERVQLASQSVARILHDAGVSFGLLYEGERNRATTCAGSARRACSRCSSSRTWRARRGRVRGDLHHRPALAERPAQRVSAVGLDKPVYHYTELFADLVAAACSRCGRR